MIYLRGCEISRNIYFFQRLSTIATIVVVYYATTPEAVYCSQNYWRTTIITGEMYTLTISVLIWDWNQINLFLKYLNKISPLKVSPPFLQDLYINWDLFSYEFLISTGSINVSDDKFWFIRYPRINVSRDKS